MGKYIRCIVLLLLIAAAVCLGIRFYPVWRAARYLHENMDLAHYAYELEVELDSGALRREYGSLFTVLTGMTGFEEDALCHLTVRGNVSCFIPRVPGIRSWSCIWEMTWMS